MKITLDSATDSYFVIQVKNNGSIKPFLNSPTIRGQLFTDLRGARRFNTKSAATDAAKAHKGIVKEVKVFLLDT